jgi:hypothetical protein
VLARIASRLSICPKPDPSSATKRARIAATADIAEVAPGHWITARAGSQRLNGGPVVADNAAVFGVKGGLKNRCARTSGGLLRQYFHDGQLGR